jgi:hypothetical protein
LLTFLSLHVGLEKSSKFCRLRTSGPKTWDPRGKRVFCIVSMSGVNAQPTLATISNGPFPEGVVLKVTRRSLRVPVFMVFLCIVTVRKSSHGAKVEPQSHSLLCVLDVSEEGIGREAADCDAASVAVDGHLFSV